MSKKVGWREVKLTCRCFSFSLEIVSPSLCLLSNDDTPKLYMILTSLTLADIWRGVEKRTLAADKELRLNTVTHTSLLSTPSLYNSIGVQGIGKVVDHGVQGTRGPHTRGNIVASWQQLTMLPSNVELLHVASNCCQSIDDWSVPWQKLPATLLWATLTIVLLPTTMLSHV